MSEKRSIFSNSKSWFVMKSPLVRSCNDVVIITTMAISLKNSFYLTLQKLLKESKTLKNRILMQCVLDHSVKLRRKCTNLIEECHTMHEQNMHLV